MTETEEAILWSGVRRALERLAPPIGSKGGLDREELLHRIQGSGGAAEHNTVLRVR